MPRVPRGAAQDAPPPRDILAIQDRFALGLGQMGRMWRSHMERILKPLGISLVQWQVLQYLSTSIDPVMQRRLALAVGVEEPVLVGVLDRLEASALVARRAATHDRRAKTVHLTPDAEKTLVRAEEELRKMRECLLEGFSAEDLDRAGAMFERIAERLLNESSRGREGGT